MSAPRFRGPTGPRGHRRFLRREDTVYGVDELPDEETADDVLQVLDPDFPSTSTGIKGSTVAIISHTDVHLSDSSSEHAAVRQALQAGKFDKSTTSDTERGEGSNTATNLNAIELDVIQPSADDQESSSYTSSSSCDTTCNCCLNLCKKKKDKHSKDEKESDK